MQLLRWLTHSVLLPIWPLEPFNPAWGVQERGLWAERAAARWLWKRGYGLREHRWVGKRRTDIDLIAANATTLVFVEVKLRTHDAENPWKDVLDPRRTRALLGAAGGYLRATRQRRVRVRFLALLIHPPPAGGRRPEVELLADYLDPSVLPGYRKGPGAATG